MSINDALKIAMKECDTGYPVGYWNKDGNFFIQFKIVPPYDELTGPSLYVVEQNGDCYGTYPYRENLNLKDMKKIF